MPFHWLIWLWFCLYMCKIILLYYCYIIWCCLIMWSYQLPNCYIIWCCHINGDHNYQMNWNSSREIIDFFEQQNSCLFENIKHSIVYLIMQIWNLTHNNHSVYFWIVEEYFSNEEDYNISFRNILAANQEDLHIHLDLGSKVNNEVEFETELGGRG